MQTPSGSSSFDDRRAARAPRPVSWRCCGEARSSSPAGTPAERDSSRTASVLRRSSSSAAGLCSTRRRARGMPAPPARATATARHACRACRRGLSGAHHPAVHQRASSTRPVPSTTHAMPNGLPTSTPSVETQRETEQQPGERQPQQQSRRPGGSASATRTSSAAAAASCSDRPGPAARRPAERRPSSRSPCRCDIRPGATLGVDRTGEVCAGVQAGDDAHRDGVVRVGEVAPGGSGRPRLQQHGEAHRCGRRAGPPGSGVRSIASPRLHLLHPRRSDSRTNRPAQAIRRRPSYPRSR